MEAIDPVVDWTRVLTRGSVIGLVLGAHLALLLVILAPPKPRPPRERVAASPGGLLQVLLLTSQRPFTPRQTTPAARSSSHATGRPPRASWSPHAQAPGSIAAALPASSSTAGKVPAYTAGGDFGMRLRAATAPRTPPKLPGGHRYLARAFNFVPIEQQSIKGKVQRVAGLLFGGYDPVCVDTQRELAQSRAQQIADGYTREDLARLQREHHCG